MWDLSTEISQSHSVQIFLDSLIGVEEEEEEDKDEVYFVVVRIEEAEKVEGEEEGDDDEEEGDPPSRRARLIARSSALLTRSSTLRLQESACSSIFSLSNNPLQMGQETFDVEAAKESLGGRASTSMGELGKITTSSSSSSCISSL